MSNLVHYLIRHPSQASAYIYPTDVEDKSYVGFGGFFLMGAEMRTELHDQYTFFAILGDAILRVPLARSGRAKTIYHADVPDVGHFEFKATRLRSMGRYEGTARASDGLVALRQLKPRLPIQLDVAAQEKQFYFIGFSPRIDEEYAG